MGAPLLPTSSATFARSICGSHNSGCPLRQGFRRERLIRARSARQLKRHNLLLGIGQLVKTDDDLV